MKNPLVTILTPCYNGEKYIQKYIDSILKQTYDNIELIIINDGSTDKTEEIILKNKSKFKKRGYKFKYFFQENQGQASAVNNGLKHVSGEYLAWPDSDDILTNDSIEIKTKFLEDNKKFGLVRTNVVVVKEDKVDKNLYILKPNSNKTNIFDDLIFEKTYCTNGAYLIRMSCFDAINPKRNIYISKGGQNWQILLPITYSFDCGYINSVGYIYIERKNSHSHTSEESYIKEIKRMKEHKDILFNTIKTIELNQNKYKKIVNTKYLKKEIFYAIKYNKKDIAKKKYEILIKNSKLEFFEKMYYIFGYNLLTKNVEKIYKKIKKE